MQLSTSSKFAAELFAHSWPRTQRAPQSPSVFGTIVAMPGRIFPGSSSRSRSRRGASAAAGVLASPDVAEPEAEPEPLPEVSDSDGAWDRAFFGPWEQDSASGPEYHPDAASSGGPAPPSVSSSAGPDVDAADAATSAGPSVADAATGPDAASAVSSAESAAAWAAWESFRIPAGCGPADTYYVGSASDSLLHPSTVMKKDQSIETIRAAAKVLVDSRASAGARVQQVLKAVYRGTPHSVCILAEHMRAARAQAQLDRRRGAARARRAQAGPHHDDGDDVASVAPSG